MIRQLKHVHDDLLQLHLRAANIETNPELAEIGLRFDELIQRLDEYQVASTSLSGRARSVSSSHRNGYEARAAPTDINGDNSLNGQDDPLADVNPDENWPHA